MRSILSVCCLAVFAGCLPTEAVDDDADEAVDESGDEPVYDDSSDTSDGPVSRDAGFWPRRDASSCDPGKPPAIVDSGIDRCEPSVGLHVGCMSHEDVGELLKKFCGPQMHPEKRLDFSSVECPGMMSEVWVSCCPTPVDPPKPADAGLPTVPEQSNCELMRFGDDQQCLDGAIYEKQARAACTARKGELKSILMEGSDCATGATAAQAICCLPFLQSI